MTDAPKRREVVLLKGRLTVAVAESVRREDLLATVQRNLGYLSFASGTLQLDVMSTEEFDRIKLAQEALESVGWKTERLANTDPRTVVMMAKQKEGAALDTLAAANLFAVIGGLSLKTTPGFLNAWSFALRAH